MLILITNAPFCFLYANVAKVFPDKVHFFDLEGFAIKISQAAGIGGEAEGQLIGIKGLVVPVEAFIQFAVLAVAQEGMSGVGKLGADLVGPTGDQLAFHQGKPLGATKGDIVGLAGFGARLGCI